MAKRAPIKKQIREARQGLRELMQEHLAIIAQNLVNQIMSRARRLPPAQALDAIKGLDHVGIADYRDALTTALAVVATDALEQVRREVPKAKNVKLSEFDDLPADVKRKIKAQIQLLLGTADADGTQISDLKKSILFQYTSSHDSTDSLDLIQEDLESAATDFIDGQSVAGSSSYLASKVVNDSRKSFLLDPEVTEQLAALQYMNEDPVTAICNDLADTVFSPTDPGADRYWPPLHWGCDGWVMPVLPGNLGGKEVTSLKPSKASLEDEIQFSETHSCKLCGRV